MELKVLLSPPPRLGLALANPFNGIESTRLHVARRVGLHLQNPFNGIERQLNELMPGYAVDVEENPFNGVERLRQGTT